MDDADAERNDLDSLLDRLQPRLLPGRFVFVTREAVGEIDLPEADLMASVREPEGISLVVGKTFADSAALEYDFIARWIVLEVDSALDAVGLTAAVSSELAGAGISCNVIAGLRHDHLLVPEESADLAVEILERLAN